MGEYRVYFKLVDASIPLSRWLGAVDALKVAGDAERRNHRVVVRDDQDRVVDREQLRREASAEQT